MTYRDKNSNWKEEYRRLSDDVPMVISQELTAHKDEILCVTFCHDGTEFVSCSKDHRYGKYTFTYVLSTYTTSQNSLSYIPLLYEVYNEIFWNALCTDLLKPNLALLLMGMLLKRESKFGFQGLQ